MVWKTNPKQMHAHVLAFNIAILNPEAIYYVLYVYIVNEYCIIM